MISISLCMIVKNEEDTLARCLASAFEIIDEIIIVDTGSTDRTKEIAAKFTAKIYDFKWIDDFSAARNFSYSKANRDYILWLDADDVILPEDVKKFKELKSTLDPSVDSVMMKYNTGFDANGNVTFSYYRERLSKRSRNFKWCEPVHEYLEKGEKVINAEICITHSKIYNAPSDRNLKIYERLLSEGKELSPRGLYYYARELHGNGRYEDAIRFFNKFLDSKRGWVEDNICACSELAKCYNAINDSKNSLESMLKSFQYDNPRADICCQIGYFFKNQGNYKNAIFWFELATRLEKAENSWGFIQHDCWGYIPCIELAVCYDKLGKIEEAIKYNDKAAEYKPDNFAVIYNKRYFESITAGRSGE